MTKEPRKKSVPYSKAIADKICALIMEGYGTREIGRMDGMPRDRNIFRWLAKNAKFRNQYVEAKMIQADYMAEEMIDISDDAINDYMERSERKSGGYELNGEHVQRSRLRIETRKWLMSKLKPKKYGDKMHLAGDESSPIKVVNRIELVALNDESED